MKRLPVLFALISIAVFGISAIPAPAEPTLERAVTAIAVLAEIPEPEPLVAPAPVVEPAAPVITASAMIATPLPTPAPVAKPVGPWDPPLATDHEPAFRQEIIWVGGTTGPASVAYICWSQYGGPVGQTDPTCPAGWGGRTPEHPVVP